LHISDTFVTPRIGRSKNRIRALPNSLHLHGLAEFTPRGRRSIWSKTNVFVREEFLDFPQMLSHVVNEVPYGGIAQTRRQPSRLYRVYTGIENSGHLGPPPPGSIN
jgi:hypothetical protein